MLEDVYRGYIDAGNGSTYPSDLMSDDEYNNNSDYALGVELASRAYFLTTSDTLREYNSDAEAYNSVKNKINELYPGIVVSSDELFTAPLWEMRPFSSPDVEVSKRFNFVRSFIYAEASDSEKKETFYTGEFSTWFKIKYFNFVEKPVEDRRNELKEFEYCISSTEKRFPGMLNKNLLEILLDETVSNEKLFNIHTVFNFSEGSYLENSVLQMMDIKTI